MILGELFLSFLQIGALSFGGGMATVPLIKDQIVDYHGWLNMSEFSDLMTIAQMTPGPIGINTATFVGLRLGGLVGALVASIAFIIPATVLLIILSTLYQKYRELDLIDAILNGLRPAIIALIATAGYSLILLAFWGEGVPSLATTSWAAVALFILALYLLMKRKRDPIRVMLLCGLLGILCHALGFAI